MPSESFERRMTVMAEPDRCWETVTDITQLVAWVNILDGAQEREHLSKYSAVLTDRIGPFSLSADLTIEVTSVTPGRSVALTAQGRDRRVDSRIYVEGELALNAVSEGTEIHIRGRYEVTGRVATFGGPMIRAKATAVIDEFLGGLAGALA